MKNKILATLLSVCMLAGLAAPAFAARVDETTSPLTAAAEEGKKIVSTKTALTIKNGNSEELLDYVTLLVDNNLAADPSTLQWDIEGDDDGAFVNTGSTYTAIADKGTAYAVVSTEDGKASIKIKLTASVNRTIYATGFKFKSTANDIKGQSYGGSPLADIPSYGNSVIKLIATPAGAIFTKTQKDQMDAVVETWADTMFTDSDTPSPIDLAWAVAKPAANTTAAMYTELADGDKEYDIVITLGAGNLIKTKAGTATEVAQWFVGEGGLFKDYAKIKTVTDYTTLKLTVETFTTGYNSTTNDVKRTASTKIRVVEPKAVAAIRNNGTLTIKVGEVKDLDDCVKLIPTNQNEGLGVNFNFDYYNTNADEMDFVAINDDNQIKGVKVGKFKVTATAGSFETTFTVNVVPFSATAATIDGDYKLANSVANTTVGGTFSLVTIPALAADADVAYGTLDASIATIDAKGVVTGVKAGTTKVWTSVAGGEKLYSTVTVAGKASNGGSTNVPNTSVASLIALF